MARNRNRNLSWTYQFKRELDTRLAIGESKYRAKRDGIAYEKIYSWGTYKTYLKQLVYFSKFIKENYKECKRIENITPEIANSYLQHHIDKGNSAYTIKLIQSAIFKITAITKKDLIETPKRLRSQIKRSRVKVKYPFAEEKNQDLVTFCRGTGLRKSELSQVRGNDLREVNGKFYLEITKNTKGGRHRIVEIIGDVDKIVELCQKAKDGKVFKSFPKDAPVHTYRAEYCKSIYKLYARHHQTIARLARERKTREVYICKKDKKGIVYDRKAMKIASENLGHSRIDVIATNYLY